MTTFLYRDKPSGSWHTFRGTKASLRQRMMSSIAAQLVAGTPLADTYFVYRPISGR